MGACVKTISVTDFGLPPRDYRTPYQWPPRKLPGRVVDGVRLVSPAELKALLGEWGEYSCSQPTGLYIGKRWLRNTMAYRRPQQAAEWMLAEVHPDKDPDYVNIKWQPLRLDPEVLAQEVEELVTRGL